MGAPLVSVVVPTRNRPRELAQTLAAVLVQPVEMEVLVVEDGPAGPAASVAARLGDPRVRLIRNTGRGGAAATRNAGIEAACGRWLAFCDDDDLWAPSKLTAQLDALVASGDRWSCTAEITVDARLRVIAHKRVTQDQLHVLGSHNVIPGGGSGVVAEAGLVRAVGGFDESLSNAEDWDLWIRLAARSALTIVDRPLLAYREWPQAKSTNVSGMTLSYNTVLARYGAWPLPPELEYVRARYLARQRRRARQRLGASRAYLALAVRHRTAMDGVRGLGVLTTPRAMERIEHRRAKRRIPDAWIDDVERWLAPYCQGGVSALPDRR